VKSEGLDASVFEVLRRFWGFDTLRPLQGESIGATLAGRDSLTVLPTGGGKSLCFQLPPMVTGKPTLVVSPLIALMQDQVAALEVAGVPAAAVHSNSTPGEREHARELVRSGRLRVLFVAPERLLMPDFLSMAKKLGIGAIAIDEAHCISQWGHDFRPEYRRLSELRAALPNVAMGAYTATATPRVQDDIVAQLRLRDPVRLVGNFDRPNLTYRILPRVDVVDQTVEALGRHPGRAAIAYCISRKDTEHLAASLRQRGVDAQAYHAGLSAEVRAGVSRDFRAEKLAVVCATVAFGMGIDRGDVRLVLHAAMPKSIEHYQQETGRAGRDGLPSECVMLYSAGDLVRWKQLGERSADEAAAQGVSRETLDAQLAAQDALLEHMHSLAGGSRCRHRALVEYFGQRYEKSDCGACDVCLGELVAIEGAHDVARKIISCVARCGQGEMGFGAGHIAEVLIGSRNAKVMQRGHDRLSTHGLLRDLSREQVVSYINQLVDSGELARASGQYPTIHLSESSAAVLRNERTARLVEPKVPQVASRRERQATANVEPLSAEEDALFEVLRQVRRELAEARGVPPFVIMGDSVLDEICRVRPGSRETLVCVKGIGTRKLEDFGDDILRAVRAHCARTGMVLDARAGSRRRTIEIDAAREPRAPRAVSDVKKRAGEMFAMGSSIEDVAGALERAPATVVQYLGEWIERERPESVSAWVAPSDRQRIESAIEACGDGPMKPIYEHLGGEVAYDAIRIVVTHRRAMSERAGS
jgi:ATP-dependent DNA helicase RecQ